jgi:DNA-binding GntR family transcriptional regulator
MAQGGHKMEPKLEVTMDEYLPLRDVVFKTLRQAILRGELKPGERLMEIKLANKLGVSRTPIREAIRKLELEGLVLMIPRRGAEVAEITEKSLNDVLEVRKALEELSVQLACERITPEQVEEMKMAAEDFRKVLKSGDVTKIAEADVKFHDIIFAATNNQRLITLLNNLREQMYRFRVEYLKQKECYPQLLEEHDKLIALISGGEVEEACELMGCHIDNQASTVSDVIRRDQVEYHR